MVRAGRTPRLRTHRQFAEQEIVLPNTGPKGGRRFRCEFQPFVGLWYDALDCGLFNRFMATGPSQSGKTLNCFVEPILYHLFEKREPVVAFAPNMLICEDKWLIDVLPTIQNSRFVDLLPRRGNGSQLGFAETITFRNGAYLKWMTGGGNDKNKAAITAKVACGTEVNAMAQGVSTSVESSPINQIAARLRAHGSRARFYMECTVDNPNGVITKEISEGTSSRIVLSCPHCLLWVTPERENFIGWEAAATELEAERLGRFYCPECGTAWTPEQRSAANHSARLVHRGQEITEDGRIVGPVPETRTFGFRWSAVNNLFSDEAQLGAEEWKAARNPDRDEAEKERCQFVWCIPWAGEEFATKLTPDEVASRINGAKKFDVPEDVETLVCQIDLHMHWHYYTVMATSQNGTVRDIVDYGLELVPIADEVGADNAIRTALDKLADQLSGRVWTTAEGRIVPLDLGVVDAGFKQSIGVEFVTERKGIWRLSKGMGAGQYKIKPRSTDIRPGEHWHDSRQSACEESDGKRWWMIEPDTDYWLHQVHSGFRAMPFMEDGTTRRPGSIAIFGKEPEIHLANVDRSVARSAFAVQICGWLWESVTTKAKGTYMAWVPQWKQDHWLDTTYGCLVADQVVRTYHPRFRPVVSSNVPEPKHFTTPDGRPYFLTERD